MAALLYLCLSVPLILLVAWLETKVRPPMIEIDRLQKSFGANRVLDGISLTVRQGRGGLHHRPLRLGQIDAAALRERARTLRGRRGARLRAPRGPETRPAIRAIRQRRSRWSSSASISSRTARRWRT